MPVLHNHIAILGLEEQGLALVQCFSRAGKDVDFFVDSRRGRQFREFTGLGRKHYFDGIPSIRAQLHSLKLLYGDSLYVIIASANLLTEILEQFRDIYDSFEVSSSPLEAVELFSNKKRCYDFLRLENLHTAPYCLLTEYVDGVLIYPLLLKRNVERVLSFKTVVLNDKDEFNRFVDNMADDPGDIIVQEFVQGDYIDLAYHAYYHRGECLGDFIVKEVRHYPEGVASFLTDVDEKTQSIIRMQLRPLFSKVSYDGFVEMDIKYNDDGSDSFLIMDINTRVPGSHSIFHYHFSNWKAFYNGIPDNPVVLDNKGKRIKWINIDRDLRSTRGSGNITKSIPDILSSSWDVFCWKDPMPFIMSFLLPIRVRLRLLLGKTSD